MDWIIETDRKPPFGKLVLVHCRVYGKFLATYEEIGYGYGNWKHNNELGILPPVYWLDIPEIP